MMTYKAATTSGTVLQLLPDLQSGGVERGTLEISNALVDMGWKSLVISQGGRLVDELESGGASHIQWPIGKKTPLTLRFVPALIRLCREQKVDILHARSRMPAWIAFWAWRCMPKSSRPVFVTTVHGLNSVNAYSRIMTRGEQVIAVSDTARSYVLQHYPKLDPDKVAVIYRGVDNNAFPSGFKPGSDWLQEWYTSFPQTRNARLLTLPGRITRRKGHIDFVELIAQLRKQHPDILGMIVGGWESKQQGYVDEIKGRIQSMGLEDAIVWTGHRSDMKEIYALSDLVFSLSNKPESFGRTILEPLCMGKRCVGLDHGGVGEILSTMFPQGKLSLGASTENWASRCNDLLSHEAPRPLPNAYPLKEMLQKEIQYYAHWMHQQRPVPR
jgi:glycosyltransferase involved in cell wall biosynthesis